MGSYALQASQKCRAELSSTNFEATDACLLLCLRARCASLRYRRLKSRTSPYVVARCMPPLPRQASAALRALLPPQSPVIVSSPVSATILLRDPGLKMFHSLEVEWYGLVASRRALYVVDLSLPPSFACEVHSASVAGIEPCRVWQRVA